MMIQLFLRMSSPVLLSVSLCSIFIFSSGFVIHHKDWSTATFSVKGEPFLRSSDLTQHYGAGIFYAGLYEDKTARDIYQNTFLGIWQHEFKTKERLESAKGFNYVYPPLVAWVASWFTIFTYPTWVAGWMGLTILFYLIGLTLIVRSIKLKSITTLIVGMMGLPPLFYTLILGQNSTLSFLIFSSVLFLLQRDKPLVAGIILSCTFYKPQFAPYLTFLMLCCGHWKFAIGAIVGTGGWHLLSLIICGPGLTLAWLQVLVGFGSGSQLHIPELNQTLWAPVQLIATSAGMSEASAKVTALLVALGALGVVTYFLRILTGRLDGSSLKPASVIFTLSLSSWLLISPYAMHYDTMAASLLWILLPIFIPKQNDDHQVIGLTVSAGFWILAFFSINLLKTPVTLSSWLWPLWFAGCFYLVFASTTSQEKS